MVSRLLRQWRWGWNTGPEGRPDTPVSANCPYVPRQQHPSVCTWPMATALPSIASHTYTETWPAWGIENQCPCLCLPGADFCLFTGCCFTSWTASEVEKRGYFYSTGRQQEAELLSKYIVLGSKEKLYNRDIISIYSTSIKNCYYLPECKWSFRRY